MSEERAPYTVTGRAPMITAEDLQAQPSILEYSNPAYRAPTPGEVDALIKLAGWSQNDVAKLVGVNYNPMKGSTTVRKWRAPLESPEHREIPYSAWRLMLIAAGLVEPPIPAIKH